MSTENKKAGAYANGRLMVEESCDEVKNDRERFEIELKEGETTIVSWTQLRIDSGLPLDSQSSTPSPKRPNRLHREHGLRSKCSNIVLKKETDEHNYCQPKKQRTGISEVLEGINVVEARNNKKKGHGRVKSITSTSHINGGHSLNNAKIELPDLNVPYTVQTASTLPTHIKVESHSMTHGSILENAILEMETMVADSRRVHGDIQDVDHPVATKNRLPHELKQKLEIVGRLVHSSQGRISDELSFRLTSILGHWLKPRALKRCLRDMVPFDLSPCGGDAARFSQFKTEVMEMIKLRNPSMATKDVSDTKTIELLAPSKAKYSMDNEMEDKICDFYDIYVQGMNQIKSSEIRKFYIQLAALWPKGTMDNHGIRNAICRSKERQRTTFPEKGHEKGNQKSSNARKDEEDLSGEAKLLSDTERSVHDANTSDLTLLDSVVPGTPELDQNLSAPAKRFSPPSASSCHDLLNRGKFNIFSESS